MPRAYLMDLEERRRTADIQPERYWRDPATRLRLINRARAKKNLPPAESFDDLRPSRVCNPRNERGQFARVVRSGDARAHSAEFGPARVWAR